MLCYVKYCVQFVYLFHWFIVFPISATVVKTSTLKQSHIYLFIYLFICLFIYLFILCLHSLCLFVRGFLKFLLQYTELFFYFCFFCPCSC